MCVCVCAFHLLGGEQGLVVHAGDDDGVHVHLLPQLLVLREVQGLVVQSLAHQRESERETERQRETDTDRERQTDRERGGPIKSNTECTKMNGEQMVTFFTGSGQKARLPSTG